MKKTLIFLFLFPFIFSLSYAGTVSEEHGEFLDKVQKEAFDYFWKETDPETGLTYNTSEVRSPATNAASGFMLSALIVGIERKWISRQEGYEMALKALKSFKTMERFHGFTYHYFRRDNASRMWSSEVSCIDIGLFLAGALTVGEYFKGTEVETIADELYRQTDWEWFLDGEDMLQMAWKPESGFFARIDRFSEGILCYILAMGSPTHPIPASCWDSFLRPVGKYGDYELIYVSDGSLFQYLFPLAWLDLREKHDKYADYWQNAISAVKANKKYCADNADKFKTFKEGFWGLSACLSPRGYKVFGAKPGRNITDGTVTTDIVAASIPLVPEFAIDDYKSMYARVPEALGQYGLTNSFNIDRDWFAKHYIAIDKGLMLLMIENYRTGAIWKYFMQNRYVQKGMAAAGFKPGGQATPSPQAIIPGNPHDVYRARKVAFPVKIDGSVLEWEETDPMILTTKDKKNVEILLGYAKDDNDVSGKFYAGWDDEYFYIAGHVTDNEIVCEKTEDKIYQDDCVEIFFDVNKDGFYFDRNLNDYQLGIAPSGPEGLPQAWAWGYKNTTPKNVRYAVKRTHDGYDIEIAIPFYEILNFKPEAGGSTLFSVSIHDRDSNGKTKKLSWSVDSTTDPEQIVFGTLVLQQ
ncbi:MAG: hypothetical protein NC938_06150 [Candidatus Omnitrophica bacterium]|nr:hypothetical protein [Candidatus Omnitrophota bacterium]